MAWSKMRSPPKTWSRANSVTCGSSERIETSEHIIQGRGKQTAMMVQTAPEGEPHFVSTMREHLELCGKLGRAFGNDRFEKLDPYDEVLYVVDNHDRGWDEYD